MLHRTTLQAGLAWGWETPSRTRAVAECITALIFDGLATAAPPSGNTSKATRVVDSARVRWVADAAERRRHRRGEVLEAARTQFALRGFEATTMRDFADAAGITAGNLYRYFESKDSMIHEILGDFSDRLLAIGAASHYQEGAVLRFGLLVNVIDRGVAASELNLVAGSDLVAAHST